MPSVELKNAERTAKRDFILDRAEALACTKGFETLTIEEIAAASGYSKRSLYLYFADREEIFFYLVLRDYRKLRKFIYGALADKTGRDSAIVAFGRRYYEFSKEYPESFSLIMNYESKHHRYADHHTSESEAVKADTELTPRERCQRASVELGDLLCRALDDERASGRLKTGLPTRALMLLLWGQLFGFLQLLIMRRDKFNDIYGVEQDALFEHLLKSLEAVNAG